MSDKQKCPKCGADFLTKKQAGEWKPEDFPEAGRPVPDWFCGSLAGDQSLICRIAELRAKNERLLAIKGKLLKAAKGMHDRYGMYSNGEVIILGRAIHEAEKGA